MYTISKTFTFDAAHQLEGLHKNHKCMNLHGHTYTVLVELKSETLNEVDFVKDYNELDVAKRYIDATLDHKNLDEVFPGMQTSAENLARTLYDILKKLIPELSAIEVSETPKTNCRYER